MTRVNCLSGKTIGQLLEENSQYFPNTLAHKGWQGDLFEKILGADAQSKPEPDFSALGVELKTIPIGHYGKPAESTFVSSIRLTDLSKQTWLSSTVYKKLSHVLWLPVESVKIIKGHNRRVGQGFLWQPSALQLEQLRRDWQELTDLICLGELDTISAKLGKVLQVRPKGASGRSLTDSWDERGQRSKTLPRGFYLRTRFTEQILNDLSTML